MSEAWSQEFLELRQTSAYEYPILSPVSRGFHPRPPLHSDTQKPSFHCGFISQPYLSPSDLPSLLNKSTEKISSHPPTHQGLQDSTHILQAQDGT